MTSAPAAQITPQEVVGTAAAAASPIILPLRASLYVGDLHPEATESDVAEAFSAVGPILSVRLCRDSLTHKSLCYAYVNFYSVFDASWALACLNHTMLRGKPMRIMWCQRDPLMRRTGAGNLYVKNLDPCVTSARLEKIFAEYGTVLSCKVVEENGISKGFGFVQFASEASAMTALLALNGAMLEGKDLYVSQFIRRSNRKAGEQRFTNLYVKNLDDNLTEDLLREKFSGHGKVCSAVIMKSDEGKSRGFGFVQFATHEEAKKAMEALDGAQFGSKRLFVGRAQKKAEREKILKDRYSVFNSNWRQESNLYVKILDLSIDDRRLKEIFSPYGKVKSARVMCHGNGVSKGFGFVNFDSPEEAKKALDALNGTTAQGLFSYVAFAQHREDRARELHNHQMQYLPDFYACNWIIFSSKYHKPHCNFLPCPPLYIPYLSSKQLVMYPNFGRHVNAWYPFGVQRYWGNHSASVPQNRSDQGTRKPHLVFQHNRMYEPNSYVSLPKQNVHSWKDQKTFRTWEIKNIHGAADESFKGSTSDKPFIEASLTGMGKKTIDKMLHPLLEKVIQAGQKAKNTGVLLEIDKTDTQKLPDSLPGLQVQMQKAANSQCGSNGAFTLTAKSSFSWHL